MAEKGVRIKFGLTKGDQEISFLRGVMVIVAMALSLTAMLDG
jgi:hypothetical protein